MYTSTEFDVLSEYLSKIPYILRSLEFFRCINWNVLNCYFCFREYAEFIEKKLKNLGLIVDLLFPNEDVPIGKVLANISSRGCLYAILVMPINEEHRSLTLNILHGIPQGEKNCKMETNNNIILLYISFILRLWKIICLTITNFSLQVK